MVWVLVLPQKKDFGGYINYIYYLVSIINTNLLMVKLQFRPLVDVPIGFPELTGLFCFLPE
jgi:hypothetical protein